MTEHREPFSDKNTMERKLRILLELLCLLGFGLLFLDIHGLWSEHLAWLGKLQLVPAALSGGIITLIAIAGLTLLLGRVYCSVICPLGILQDIIRHFRRNTRSTYRPNKKYLRLAALLVFAAGLGLGFSALALTTARGVEPRFEQLFDGFRNYTSSLVLYILVWIFTLLWTLLFVIPGIIMSYAYSMSWYILADNPDMPANEARKRSIAMMRGNKELFQLASGYQTVTDMPWMPRKNTPNFASAYGMLNYVCRSDLGLETHSPLRENRIVQSLINFFTK